MNRRSFISGLGVLIGGLALEQAIPLGRVWSFPSVIQPVAPKVLAFHRDAFAVVFREKYEVTSGIIGRIDVMYGTGHFIEGEPPPLLSASLVAPVEALQNPSK